ncbi:MULTISPECIES: polysaccharide biosynthesis/export family protein [unclassified Acinetobacter]|uniref:polysaccharide biosynthesis/export family protein n=1 Tax=unclassified Acinetobacter TaxID=196816 RepID=UPI0035B784B3
MLSGCSIGSGLQTHNLPKDNGESITPQGAHVDLIPLTQENIPQIRLQQLNNKGLSSGGDVRQLFSSQPSEYRLSPTDVLSVQLWAYPEITPPQTGNTVASGYTIDSSGYLSLPMIGRVKAAGRTLNELTNTLRSQYSRYLRTPDVTARVISYQGQRYVVNGQVLKSGQYNISDQPVSLYTALSMAGGINPETGDSSNIQLIRNGKTYTLNTFDLEKAGLSLHRLLIHPNDTIFVSSRQNQKVYVMGESNKSQSIVLRDQGMSLSDVLGESEGLNPNSASAGRIYVMRTDEQTGKSHIYQLDLSHLGNFALANQFMMQRNDIVYIDATGLTRWQRIVNQLVPFSNALYSLKQTGL